MRNLSALVNESAQVDIFTAKEVEDFTKKFDKKMSDNAKLATKMCVQYNIVDKDSFMEVVKGNAYSLKRLASELGAPLQGLSDLKKVLLALQKKDELSQVPFYAGHDNAVAAIAGNKTWEDITLDFETERGKTAIVKKYTKVLKYYVDKNTGKSGLTKEDLWSVAYAVMAYCIKTYAKNEKVSLSYVLGNDIKIQDPEDVETIENADKEVNDAKKASFETYLSCNLRYAILIEMNKNSRVVSLGQNGFDWNNSHDSAANFSLSIDQLGDGEDSGSTDHYKFLGQDPDADKAPEDAKTTKSWMALMAKLKKEYSDRDLMMFMKVWGIGGFEEKSQSEVAKKFGISQSFVGRTIRNILKSIQSDKTFAPYLQALKDEFNESLAASLYKKGRKEIIEALTKNDIYLLFEEFDRAKDDRMRVSEICLNLFLGEDLDWFDGLFDGSNKLDEKWNEHECSYRKFLNCYDIFENYNLKPSQEVYSAMRSIINNII